MDQFETDRLRNLSERLIRQADPIRVATAHAVVSDELHGHLSGLISCLSALANDVELWRALSQADYTRAAQDRARLSALGDQPWFELLAAGGYSYPPPPDPAQMAASLSSNVRHALERQEFQSQREFREAALFARKRLLRLIERLDERLDLSGASSPTLHGLPFLAKIGVDVAIDSAAAVAVPQILALPAVGAESIVSGGMALGAQLIMHTLEKTWRAVSDYREIRKPLLPTVGEDPVLQILSLLQSMVQQGRSIAAQHFPDQLAMSAVHTALDRYTSMMRKTLLDLPGHLNSWTVAEKMLTHVRFEPPYADADFDAKQLSRALDEVWEERSGGAHGRSL